MLIPFSVECFRASSGKDAWSQTCEAYNAAEALAECCLEPHERAGFIVANDEDPDFLECPHPAEDMDDFTVRAERITS